MSLSGPKKVALGIAGAVILGAIGSGVWEVMFSPAVKWLSRVVLSVVTLGIESARDSIYSDVAKGYHELPSLSVYAFLMGFLLAFPLCIIVFLSFRSRLRHFLRPKSRDELHSRLRRRERILVVMTVLVLLLSSVSVVRFVMHNYVNLAVTHFEQSMRIIGPFIDVSQERQLRSEFASIERKSDFIAVLSKITEIARVHEKALPDFTPW